MHTHTARRVCHGAALWQGALGATGSSSTTGAGAADADTGLERGDSYFVAVGQEANADKVTAAKATSDAKGDGTDGKRVSIREALLPGADSDIPVAKSAVIDDDDVGDSDVVVGGVPCSPFYIYIYLGFSGGRVRFFCHSRMLRHPQLTARYHSCRSSHSPLKTR